MGTTILVPLDGSTLAERALPYATALARTTRGRLVLFHARPALALAEDWPFDPGSAAEPLRAEGIDAEPSLYLMYGDETARAICATALKQRADLVVMSTHGRGGISRWLFGSVADQVLRQAEVPVLLVSAICERRWPTDRAPRILVPLDGSALAEEVLGPVGALVKEVGAKLILLRAVEDLSYPFSPVEPFYVASRLGFELEPAQEYLERVADGIRGPGRPVEILAVDGRAVPTIVQIAREQEVDLIALATHGRGGISRLILGSTATGTLQQATVPLLLVRPAAVRQAAGQATSRATVGHPLAPDTSEGTTGSGAGQAEDWRPTRDQS